MTNRFSLVTVIAFSALMAASPLSISLAKGVDGGKTGAASEYGKGGGVGETGGKAGAAGETGGKSGRGR
jgi:hypothetical protein